MLRGGFDGRVTLLPTESVGKIGIRSAPTGGRDRASAPVWATRFGLGPLVASASMFHRAGGARPRRTWPQRLLITFNVLCILAALTTAGTVAQAKRKVSQINRFDLTGTPFVGTKALSATDPVNFLVVGADSSQGLAANDPANAGRETVGGIRSDTIMIVRLEPKTRQARVLSFPRDLWVDIPGRGKGKINSALEFSPDGKPGLLIATLKQNFQIDVNHYVQVDFEGFKQLVRAVDGVPIYFPTPVHDGSSEGSSGLNIATAGCTKLDENGALNYVRSRHLYRVIDGKRVRDGSSDLGRISRQQDFMKRVIKRATKQGVRNPVKLVDFVNIAVGNIQLDQETSPRDLVALGTAFRNFDPQTLGTYSLPVSYATRQGQSVLDLIRPAAEPILAQFRATGAQASTSGLRPATVTVRVKNGTNTANQAASTTDALARIGFRTDPPGTDAPVMRTQVRYPPGQAAPAALVARHLSAQPDLIVDADVSVLTVVTGPDFVQVLPTARSAADVAVPTTSATSVSTTTRPSATTTTTTKASTTTTTAAGYVPIAPPRGVNCE